MFSSPRYLSPRPVKRYMDANALLRRQGWKGSGHSLDTTGRGIKKPLLIAHKQDQLGLGEKRAAWKTDDQWWMRAFDESLQNIGTGQKSTLTEVREKGVNRGGLYGFFVKGEGLEGTITSGESSAAEGESTETPASKASTPPTSASETENAATMTQSAAMTKKNNKRKRGKEEDAAASKKMKHDTTGAAPADEPAAVPAEAKTPMGTFDVEQITKMRSFLFEAGKVALRTVEKNAKKPGYYGFMPPADAEKGRRKGEPHPLFEDPATGRKVTVRTAKMEREKNMREDKRDIIKTQVIAAMLSGDFPNPKGWTEDEIVANWEDMVQRSILIVEKTGKKVGKASKEQEKQEKVHAAREQRRLAKEARLAAKAAAAKAEAEKQRAVISKKISKLHPQERIDYEQRAAEKNMSLEEYTSHRIAKKAAKKAAEAAAAKEEAKAASMFVVDLEGDAKLAEDLTSNKQTPLNYTPLADGSCPIDPTIWEGHSVKSLPKPVREARRKWMQQQRDARKIRAGKKVEKGPSRGEKKLNAINAQVGKILREQGLGLGATKEQKGAARRMAKTMARHQKKLDKAEGKGKKKAWSSKTGRSG